MRILALDLGKRMGVADGDSALLRGTKVHGVTIEAVTLRGTSAEARVRYLARWLDKQICERGPGDPFLIVTEAPMNPAAQRSDHATIDMQAYYFCLHTVAGLLDIDVEPAPVMAVRKHFVGMACAPRIKGRKRTQAEAQEARKFINEAVLKRAILLGYLPEGSKDWDQANACALWDWGCAKFGRAQPSELIMFGARA
jgi:hypothetical protein